jgi:hypothetical protein
MPQNLRLELIQSLFLVNDGKSAAFVPQNSNGAMDRRQTTDRPSYPDLLRSQMGYILDDKMDSHDGIVMYMRNKKGIHEFGGMRKYQQPIDTGSYLIHSCLNRFEMNFPVGSNHDCVLPESPDHDFQES